MMPIEPYTPPQELLKEADTARRIYGDASILANVREKELFLLVYKLAQCIVQLDQQMNPRKDIDD